MRKFLRLLMLVLMAAYGTQGWGTYVKFAGDHSAGNGGSWSGNTVTGTHDGVTVKLTLANGTFSSGKFRDLSTGDSFVVPSGSTFTIESTTSGAKIVYIAFSLDNGYVLKFFNWAQNNSNNNWQIKEGGGGLHSTSHYSGHDDWWSQSYWEKDDNSNGVSKVVFYNSNNHDTRLLWMYVYCVTNSETAASKVSLAVTGIDHFESESTFTITTTSGNNVYYTTNGTMPTASSANGKTGTTGTVSESCVVQAATYTTYQPTSSYNGDRPDDGDKNVKRWYYSDKKVFTRYYKGPVKGPAGTNEYYGTLCYPYAVKVPSGCTAGRYKYKSGKATLTDKYGAGSFIPANTPVLVYSTASGDKEFDWVNTYNKESAPATPSSDGYCLEGNPTDKPVTPDSEDGYTYFGLMMPTQAQKDRGLGFGFYQFNYQGTCGAIPAYKAYLKVKTSNLTANAAKEGISFDFFGDDNNTTGISVIPATLDGASGRQVRSTVRYNLSGQQVGPDYKGIVIVNGRKMVVK